MAWLGLLAILGTLPLTSAQGNSAAICPDPSPVHGRVDQKCTNLPLGGPYPARTDICVACDEGYFPVGGGHSGSLLSCSSIGQWQPPPPICIPVGEAWCNLPELTHGTVSGRSSLYNPRILEPTSHNCSNGRCVANDFAVFRCDPGYHLVGYDYISCLGRDTWAAPFPICEIACPRPEVRNGLIYDPRMYFPINTTVFITCDSGYFRPLPWTRTCQSDGSWTELECMPVNCGNISVANAEISFSRPRASGGGYSVGTVASFTCKYGYSLSGTDSRTCQASGFWTQFNPACNQIFCPSRYLNHGRRVFTHPSDLPLGGISGEPVDTVVTFSCNSEYYLSGPSSFTCHTSGSWSPGGTSKCNRILCESIDVANAQEYYSSSVVNGKYRLRTRVTFECVSGYSLSGPYQKTCMQSGTTGYWAGETTTCNAPPPPSSSCFPGKAKVKLENGKSITMSEIQIGNHVQSVSKEGSPIYSKVAAFLKRHPGITTTYKSFATSRNNSVNLSEDHLIYARKNCADKFSPMYAGLVSIGNEVLVEGNGDFVPAKVINVFSFVIQGAYVPLTMDGKIIVDGVLASCYAVDDHDISHMLTTPLRWFPDFIELIFGDDKEMPAYVNILLGLAK